MSERLNWAKAAPGAYKAMLSLMSILKSNQASRRSYLISCICVSRRSTGAPSV